MAYEENIKTERNLDRRNTLFPILIAAAFILIALVYFSGRDNSYNDEPRVNSNTPSPLTSDTVLSD